MKESMALYADLADRLNGGAFAILLGNAGLQGAANGAALACQCARTWQQLRHFSRGHHHPELLAAASAGLTPALAMPGGQPTSHCTRLHAIHPRVTRQSAYLT